MLSGFRLSGVAPIDAWGTINSHPGEAEAILTESQARVHTVSVRRSSLGPLRCARAGGTLRMPADHHAPTAAPLLEFRPSEREAEGLACLDHARSYHQGAPLPAGAARRLLPTVVRGGTARENRAGTREAFSRVRKVARGAHRGAPRRTRGFQGSTPSKRGIPDQR